MNYLFGLTRIPMHHFFIATWFSLLPLASMFVYLGSLIGDIAKLGERPAATGNTKWVITGIGLISTIIVTIMVTRIARRTLAGKLESIEQQEAAT